VTRSAEEVQLVLALGAQGLNQSEIARQTGISRTSVRHWLRGETPNRVRSSSSCIRCGHPADPFPELTEFSYAYLLGLYLGDGWITAHRRGVYQLHIVQFDGYPRLIGECAAAMSVVMPSSKVSVRGRPDSRAAEVRAYSQHWPCLFPQHGPGRKHSRRILLAAWQRQIADCFPGRLLRGLIHSDGCRGTNTVRSPRGKTYSYPRYQFSNRSGDIRAIFCEYCDKLGVEWRQMNRWNISVARRESVARLDRYVGPKQ
jgi:hypothetical protein